MFKPRSRQNANLPPAAIDAVLTESTPPAAENAATVAEASRDDEVAKKPRLKTSVPPQVWVSSLAGRERFHELALIFLPDSYHARTDTADEKRRLAKKALLKAGPAAVDALIDMLIERDASNTDIAELLIEIDAAKAAPLLRQLLETGQLAHEPRNIHAYVTRHLGE